MGRTTTRRETRAAARDRIDLSGARAAVADAFRAAGERGLTPDECAEQLGRTVLQVRPRVCELAKAGYLIETGERRPTASGGTAAVMRWNTGKVQGSLF